MLARDSNCRAKLGVAKEDRGSHSGVPFGVMAPEALQFDLLHQPLQEVLWPL